MSALPRPALTGPSRSLNDALHDLHHRAGWPSLRTLARETGVSHTTVSKAFSQPALPSWGTLELLVEAMGGDPTRFHELWLAASAPTDGAPAPPPRIAGRRAELEAVRRHLETGTGLLLVTGEAGIGKSKLLATATDLMAEERVVATGSCLPLSSAVPMLAIADALQRVYDEDGGLWMTEALASSDPYVAESMQRLVPAIERIVPSERHPDDDWSRHRLFTAVAAAIKALDAARSLALVFEDLHWADAATLDLLEHLLIRGAGVPVVGSYRTDDPATLASTADWLVRMRRLPGATTLQLGPLDLAGTAEQLSLLLRHPPDPTQVARVHARTEGLPLFTEQLAGSMDANHPIPGLLGDLLDARLVGLGDRAWAIAKALGVADRGLPTALARDAGGLSGPELVEGLRDLHRRRLLLSSTDPDFAQLRHPLLAEAVRRRLVAGESAEQHGRLARALARQPDPEAAEIALHWQCAGEPEEEAVWRVTAARAAADRFAATEEMKQWRRVIALHREGHEAAGGPTLSEVYCAAIDAAWKVGLKEESEELVSQALSILSGLEGKARADLCFRAATRNMGVVRPIDSLPLADEAISTYRTIEPTIELALCLERRSMILRSEGRWEEAARDLEEAAEVCRTIGDVGSLRWMLAGKAWQEAMLGNRAAALRGISEACALAPPAPDPAGDVRLGMATTDVLLKCGGTADEIVAAATPGLIAAEKWDAALFAGAVLRSNVVEALMRAGRITEAEDLLDRAAAQPGVGDLWLTQLCTVELAVVRGELEKAAERAAILVAVDRASLNRRLETHLVAARVDLWRGLAVPASRRLLALLSEVATSDDVRFAGPHFVLAVRAAADQTEKASAPGRPVVAGELLARLQELLAGATVAPFGRSSALADADANEALWRAELARAAGGHSPDGWMAPAAAWDDLDRPHDAAYCRWRAAQVALRDGQGTLAARLLKRAAADAREHVPLSRAIAETAAGRR